MLVIQCSSKENMIQYPDHVSEFEVHADLYLALKMSTKADIRAEVKSRGTHGIRPAKTACRFDIVAFVNGEAICIIEVKGCEVRHKTTMEDTRQGKRYPTFGVPVIVCYGQKDIHSVVEQVAMLAQ